MNSKLENLQFLGIYGILQETMKLIYQCRKIFTQITLAFILPFYLLTFANMAISLFFHPKTNPSNDVITPPQIIYYFIFNILSLIFTSIFYLLSIATVIYTVTCIYTERDVSFKHVISIVPKVWKRLLVTFLCVLVALFAFNFVAFLILSFIFAIVFSINGPNHGFSFDHYTMILTIIFIFMILVAVGIWYLTLIGQLSFVVSVLEELCGFKAMAKSKALVKGKMIMITMLFLLLGLPLGVIQQLVFYYAIQSPSVGVVVKCILGIVLVLLFSLVLLVMLVTTIVLYFVCKSYHHEVVDKVSLSNHLQSFQLAINYDPLLKVDDDDQIKKLQVV